MGAITIKSKDGRGYFLMCTVSYKLFSLHPNTIFSGTLSLSCQSFSWHRSLSFSYHIIKEIYGNSDNQGITTVLVYLQVYLKYTYKYTISILTSTLSVVFKQKIIIFAVKNLGSYPLLIPRNILEKPSLCVEGEPRKRIHTRMVFLLLVYEAQEFGSKEQL